MKSRDIAIAVLMFTVAVSGAYAQVRPIKMTYSGTTVSSTINLQPDTATDDELLAGNSALGTFTFRELHSDTAAPSTQPPDNCSAASELYFPTVAGGGVFRFQDGSLMTVTITHGSTCVDLAAGVAHLSETYQITGGTGRFKGASGTLTMKGLLSPVLFDASGSPDLLTNTGEFEGTIFRAE